MIGRGTSTPISAYAVVDGAVLDYAVSSGSRRNHRHHHESFRVSHVPAIFSLGAKSLALSQNWLTAALSTPVLSKDAFQSQA